ncbi:MAG: ankyrin repeat domain-containing protein [Acidobacteria bacterium]|nr:ankyrin repeat domain-containing protein [Acidobacteriota bacterium]
MRTTALRRCLLVLGVAALNLGAGPVDLQLIDAAKNADQSAVRALLKQGANVNASEADGTTALHWAGYRDDLETADLLIRAGARINAANDLGVTPLWAACENGSTAMAQKLLQAGADPNTTLMAGETLLMTAARAGNADVVKLLLSKGANVNAKERAHGQTALMWAVAQRHPAVVEALLAGGADVHVRTNVWTEVVKTTLEVMNPAYVTDIQQGGYTPLLFAARAGDLASATLLVAAGADVNDTAPYGTSALVVAAHSGHGEVAQFLLDKGADPNSILAGYTALHAALLHKDEKLVAALLAKGASPNTPLLKSTPTRRESVDFYFSPGMVGATPLWLAARFRSPKIMALLLERGADPQFVHHPTYFIGRNYGDSRTLLHEGPTTVVMAAAGLGGESPIFSVDRLARIAEGAPVDSQRREPLSPAEMEAITFEAVRLAAERGVDVNAANADGNTALHTAAARGYNSVVKYLVDKGARLDVRNKKGQTPLAAATTGTLAMSSPPSRFLPIPPGPKKSTIELLRSLGATE